MKSKEVMSSDRAGHTIGLPWPIISELTIWEMSHSNRTIRWGTILLESKSSRKFSDLRKLKVAQHVFEFWSSIRWFWGTLRTSHTSFTHSTLDHNLFRPLRNFLHRRRILYSLESRVLLVHNSTTAKTKLIEIAILFKYAASLLIYLQKPWVNWSIFW